MELTFEFWYLLPISIIIATIAMSSGVGGAFLGMISVGLAEMQEYHLIARCKVPPPVAVGTSILVVVVTVLVASAGHFYAFFQEGPGKYNQGMNLLIFIAPGVIIGGQLGARI
ncbi:MAG: hypothetical protein ACNA7V_02745 [Bacteroidales bacterium]